MRTAVSCIFYDLILYYSMEHSLGAYEGEKVEAQAQLLFNRCTKQYKRLKKWARKKGIGAFRMYDRDIPEIPLAIDVYTFLPSYIKEKAQATAFWQEQNAVISQNTVESQHILQNERERTFLRLYLYERPYEKPVAEEQAWLSKMADVASRVVGIEKERVIIKMRKKQNGTKEGRLEQYEKNEHTPEVSGIVFEQGQIFFVNISTYIDTGLFFDHRPLRRFVRDESKGKKVLNLFCYTGSFSVYAAEGGASFVQSVDLSNTYLSWAKKNMACNGFAESEHFVYTKTDVFTFLKEAVSKNQHRYDIIILDPPTFSNSKSTAHTLDINKDWAELVSLCVKLLEKRGALYFSTNSLRLQFSEQKLPCSPAGTPLYRAEDITSQTIPEDFRSAKIHRVWKITPL